MTDKFKIKVVDEGLNLVYASMVGITCAMGAAQMTELYKSLADMNAGWYLAYRNVGLSNAMGSHDKDFELLILLVI
eukprot:7408409-Heterocapsa_arctica.AAC.1